jgi:hypothetical protein
MVEVENHLAVLYGEGATLEHDVDYLSDVFNLIEVESLKG